MNKFIIVILLTIISCETNLDTNSLSENRSSSGQRTTPLTQNLLPNQINIYNDLFRVTGNKKCSESLTGKTINCHNEDAPPLPSSLRTIDYEPKSEDGDYVSTKVMSQNDVSNDLRVYFSAIYPVPSMLSRPSGSIAMVSLLKPNKVQYNNKVIVQEKDSETGLYLNRAEDYIHSFPLNPIMYMDPRPGKTGIDYADPDKAWNTFHFMGCQKGLNVTSRKCNGTRGLVSVPTNGKQNALASSSTIAGNCYDITMMYSLENSKRLQEVELRSVDLTLFVEDIFGAQPKVYPFPQSSQTTFNLNKLDNFYSWGNGDDLTTMANKCNPGETNKPYYCQYLPKQKFLSNHKVHKRYGWENQSDPYDYYSHTKDSNYYFFEPSVTGDGHLAVFNTSDSVYYSYLENACDASSMTTWKPLSLAHTDDDLFPYGISKYPLRNNKGETVPPGRRFPGAYMWIDKKGNNVFFAAQQAGRDHLYSRRLPSGSYSAKLTQLHDKEPGKQVSIVGSWTKGKLIVPDTVLNYSDLGGNNTFYQNGSPAYRQFLFKLFSTPDDDHFEFWTRGKASRQINSFEHFFNAYDALSPKMPFDVVWTVMSNNGMNSDIVFDEYMMNQALIVGHMNASLQEIKKPSSSHFRLFPDDGFFPEVIDNFDKVRSGKLTNDAGTNLEPRYSFIKSPKIQNASTSDKNQNSNALEVPSELELLGGARIEPFGLGGIRGKGVFLDGKNDHIKSELKNQNKHDWMYSIWLDSRNYDDKKRVLFYWGDGSYIALNSTTIFFYNNEQQAQTTKTISIPQDYVDTEKYYHYGFEIIHSNFHKKIRLFIDGDRVGPEISFHSPGGGFSFVRTRPTTLPPQPYPNDDVKLLAKNASNITKITDTVLIDDPGSGGSTSTKYLFYVGLPSFYSIDHNEDLYPIKGWVDELRVYHLDETLQRTAFFNEFICNLAMGTKVKVTNEDSSNRLVETLYNKAQLFGLFKGLTTHTGNTTVRAPIIETNFAYVCEQMSKETFDERSDLPHEDESKVCFGKTHRNNENSQRCVRNALLSFHPKPVAGSPRPNFVTNKFCLSCHNSEENVDGLKVIALTEGTVNREHDLRRQPMDVPQKQKLCYPNYSPYPSSNQSCTGDLLQDYIFDFNDKVLPQ